MKKTLLLISSITLMLLISTGNIQASVTNNISENDIELTQTNSDIDLLAPQISTQLFDANQVHDGYNLFALRRQDAGINGFNHADILVTDMEGSIINSLSSPGNNRMSDPEMINSTTVFLRDSQPFFWNLETNVTEYFPFESGGHDMEYNPVTETFLVKQWADRGNYSGQEIRYNDLFEIDKEGNVLWYWNSTEYFPFNPDVADGESLRGRVVWMHANSIFWDYENDAIYLGARGHDTFYKIDKTTGDVEWGVGRLGNFTLFDINGNEKDSLFYHQHAVELISENRFILYDNDYLNTTRENPSEGIPRMIEIEIDETTMEAREVWVYTAPAEYFGAPWGDADLLPGGNRLGAFGHIVHDAYLTEVNEQGEIVWEMTVAQLDDYAWGMYRAERFYSGPIIQSSILDQENVFTINYFDTIKWRAERSGTVTLSQNGETITQENIVYNPHFQETTISFDFDDFNVQKEEITISLVDQDGKSTELSVFPFPSTSTTSVDLFPVLGLTILLFPVLVRKLKVKSD